MSEPDIESFVTTQEYWILPERNIEPALPEPTYPSGTQAQIGDSVSYCVPCAQRMLDAKSGLQVCVLNVPKNARAIDETEGVLSHLAQELEEQSLEPVDLVKRAWKSSEHDAQQPSA